MTMLHTSKIHQGAASRANRTILGKRGDWIQLFMVMFFFLILAIALALFFTEKDALRTVRPELYTDLAHNKMQSALMGTLRMPVMYDIDGDGVEETIPLATRISLGITEEDLALTLDGLLPKDVPYEFTITYPNRQPIQVERLNRNVMERIFAHFPSAANVVKQTSPKGRAELPSPSGTITVELIWGDAETLYLVFRQKYVEDKAKEYAREGLA